MTETRPAPATTPIPYRWAVSDRDQGVSFFTDTSRAAEAAADEAMWRLRRGQAPSVTVQLRDPDLGVLWDATSDVADVLAATGWPALDGDVLKLRAGVIRILTAILIADDTPTDFAAPAAEPRPVPRALICR